jgi:hypothetical protein
VIVDEIHAVIGTPPRLRTSALSLERLAALTDRHASSNRLSATQRPLDSRWPDSWSAPVMRRTRLPMRGNRRGAPPVILDLAIELSGFAARTR